MWELEAHHGARIARPISDRRAAIPGAKSGTGSVQELSPNFGDGLKIRRRLEARQKCR
jgi:hypothetical protein